MAATGIKSPSGGGKTTTIAKRIAHANEELRIEVYVPTHALAVEWRDLINKFNPTRIVRIISGRNHVTPGGKPLCNRHQIAARISQAGQSVYTRLCSASSGHRCGDYDNCPYINQFNFGHVYIYTHAYLPLDRGLLDARVPNLVVIDEAFAMACLERIEFNVSLLRHPALPNAASSLCGDISNLLQSGSSLYPLISNASKRGGGLRAAVEELRASAPRPQPGQSDQLIVQTLGSAPNFEPVAKLLEHLKRAFAVKQELQSVDFDAITGQITVHHRNDITRFTPKSSSQSPPEIFLLDATASRETTEVFFTGATFHEFRARRNAHVVQCRSARCSIRSINPNIHSDPKSMAEAMHKLGEIQQLINELSSNGSKLLVVGPVAITGNPSKNTQPLVNVPPHSALAHFGALRGVDVYKDFDTVLVISRNEPSVAAVQDLARAMFYDATVPLQLTDRWVQIPRAYQLKSDPEGVDVDCHPDIRVQAILEQLRESESLQAIDRLRLIHCQKPKLVVLLSNIPLDIEVDALFTWDELVHGNRLEQAWRKTGDVMPIVPEWLSTNFNSLWPTAAAAKKDVQRQQVKKGQFTNRLSICKLSPFTFEYRAPGQRRASTCLSRVACPNAVSEALKGLLGHPVTVIGPLPDSTQ
ncbi:MAG: hypothetical protein IPH35_18125 [Rhodoferax sp.]|nr:hypothetical protein [Rhodoferax sp.]